MLKKIDKWLILQLLTILAILLTTPFTSIQLPLWLRTIGGVLFAIGLVVSMMALFHLGSSLSPFVKPKEQGKLVTSGMYKIVRHPIYSGLLLLALGWTIMWGTLSGMLLFFILFFILNQKASEEEKWLEKKYPEYAAYKARVRKIIPFIY